MLNYRQLFYFWSVAKAGGIARAARQLHLTPQTLSGQISQLEQSLGVSLFNRIGRRLELSDAGERTLPYAEEIFQLGGELQQSLRSPADERLSVFRAGLADALPKSIAYRLLAPALALPEPVRLICREAKLERLLGELAIHHLDMVLSDKPMPAHTDVKGFSHRLGSCGLSFLATSELASTLPAQPFPACLEGAALLTPGEDSATRGPLLRWLRSQEINVRLVGEFDDGALMKAFGKAGAGVFPVPSAIAEELARDDRLVVVGSTLSVKEHFFLITVQKRISHPAAVAISEAAQHRLFA